MSPVESLPSADDRNEEPEAKVGAVANGDWSAYRLFENQPRPRRQVRFPSSAAVEASAAEARPHGTVTYRMDFDRRDSEQLLAATPQLIPNRVDVCSTHDLRVPRRYERRDTLPEPCSPVQVCQLTSFSQLCDTHRGWHSTHLSALSSFAAGSPLLFSCVPRGGSTAA